MQPERAAGRGRDLVVIRLAEPGRERVAGERQAREGPITRWTSPVRWVGNLPREPRDHEIREVDCLPVGKDEFDVLEPPGLQAVQLGVIGDLSPPCCKIVVIVDRVELGPIEYIYFSPGMLQRQSK